MVRLLQTLGRRDLIIMIGAASAGAKDLALAQSSAKRPLIGVLGGATAAIAMNDGIVGGFRQGLRELGYVEGQNIDVAYRFAEGDPARLPSLAQELVNLKPDVLFTAANQGGIALKTAAPSIPIVVGGITAESKLFVSYARPGGNVTGISSLLPGMTGKLFEIATEAVPGASKLGFLDNEDDPGAPVRWNEIEAASAQLKVEVVRVELHTPDQIEAAIQKLAESGAKAVIVASGGWFFNQRQRITSAVTAARLPAICTEREYISAGALISYGVTNRDIGRRAAAYVDKILKGAAPADLPIEFPTTLTLAVNLKAAKSLGVTISPSLLMRADEVVE